MSQLAGADLEDFRHLVKLGHQATGRESRVYARGGARCSDVPRSVPAAATVKPQLFAALHRVETDFSSQAGVLKHLTSVTASSAASQHEAASVSIHATLRCAGFKCVERGEGGDAPVPGFEPPKRGELQPRRVGRAPPLCPFLTSPRAVLDRDTLLPRGWNRQGDLFTFHYEHEEAQGAAFVLKVRRQVVGQACSALSLHAPSLSSLSASKSAAPFPATWPAKTAPRGSP